MDVTKKSDETLTRNWNELLQEIRVTETGVQLLTGFLLTIPFTQRFSDLTSFQRHLYLVVLTGSIATTALVVAPVAYHRVLFRQHQRPWLVAAANQCARASLVLMALTISGVAFLVFDVVVGSTAGAVAFACVLVAFTLLWGVAPLASDRRHRDD